jgi:hypothetical protein
MNIFTFDFPNLKDKVLSNKTRCDIGIIRMGKTLVPWEYRWKSQVIEILSPTISKCNGYFVVMCFSLILTFYLFLF